MNTQFAIILSEGKEYLCYKEEDSFVDVSFPMMTFTAGEDDFEIVKCNRHFPARPFRIMTGICQSHRKCIITAGWHYA